MYELTGAFKRYLASCGLDDKRALALATGILGQLHRTDRLGFAAQVLLYAFAGGKGNLEAIWTIEEGNVVATDRTGGDTMLRKGPGRTKIELAPGRYAEVEWTFLSHLGDGAGGAMPRKRPGRTSLEYAPGRYTEVEWTCSVSGVLVPSKGSVRDIARLIDI